MKAALFHVDDAFFKRMLLCSTALGLSMVSERCAALAGPASIPSSIPYLSYLWLPLGLGVTAFLVVASRICNIRDRCLRLAAELDATRKALTAAQEDLARLRVSEESARLNAHRFRSLTSLSSDWYWEQDVEMRFTMCTALQAGGDVLAASAFIGRRPWELDGIVQDPGWDSHRETLQARKSFRGFEYQARLGERVRWFSINGEPLYDDTGSFIGYRGTARDISRRKRAELALRTSEERFHEIIGSMPVGVFIKDPESRVLLMNRECERQWGVTLEQIQGTDGALYFTPEEMAEYLAADRAAFRHGKLVQSETTARNLVTGEVFAIEALKKPVFDDAGKPRYLIGISVDVTQRKHAEEQLRRSRELLRELSRHQVRVKEEERKRIARDIHDELGQNLMALRLDVEAMMRGVLPDTGPAANTRARLMMDTVDRTIRSVRHIINDLRPAVLDLGLVAALEWQTREFVRRSGIACDISVTEAARALELDDMHATTLFRVLQESLTNVQRHSGATAVTISLSCDAMCAYLDISDNGKGGVALETGREMQSFGLLGMRERLRMLGGRLDLADRAGGGTILCASIPFAASYPGPDQAPSS